MTGIILALSLVLFLWTPLPEAKGLNITRHHRLGEKVPDHSAPSLRIDFPPEIIYRSYPAAWRKWTGSVPGHAVPGGWGPDGQVYICMVAHYSGYLNGMFEDDECVVTYGGDVFHESDFYILTAPEGVLETKGLKWRPVVGGGVPDCALPAGKDGDLTVYVAKTLFGAYPAIGKYVAEFGNHYFHMGDDVIVLGSSKILCKA